MKKSNNKMDFQKITSKTLNNASVLQSLTNRELLLYFKDKMSVFFSIMAPIIILILYIFFIGDLQMKSLTEFVSKSVPNMTTELENLIKSYNDSWMLAGVLSIACITVSFSACTIMVQDRSKGVLNDMLCSPIQKWIIRLSYFLYIFIATIIMVLIVAVIGFIYLGASGHWNLTVADVFGILGNIVFSSLSSTLITVFIASLFRTEAQLSSFIGITSAVVGFLIGAYMPMHLLPNGIQYVSALIPGSHSAGMFRQLFMNTTLDKIGGIVNSPQIVDSLKNVYGLDVNFFGHKIGMGIMAVYMVAFIVLFAVLNVLFAYRRKRKSL